MASEWTAFQPTTNCRCCSKAYRGGGSCGAKQTPLDVSECDPPHEVGEPSRLPIAPATLLLHPKLVPNADRPTAPWVRQHKGGRVDGHHFLSDRMELEELLSLRPFLTMAAKGQVAPPLPKAKGGVTTMLRGREVRSSTSHSGHPPPPPARRRGA